MLKVRLDTWLWAARFFKTRQLAKEAILGGKVKVNHHKAKVSTPVKENDLIKIQKGNYTFDIQVLGLSNQRSAASVAQTLYEESSESKEKRQLLKTELKMARMASPNKKPDKKDRKKLRQLRDKS